jgi:hypothetical protein
MKMRSRSDQMMDAHVFDHRVGYFAFGFKHLKNFIAEQILPILISEVKLREPVIDIQNRFKIEFNQYGSRFSA